MEIKEAASIVLVGAWNLSILNPDWYAREFPQLEMKGKDIPVEMEVATGSLRFEAKGKGLKINPNPTKLILSCTDDSKNYDLISEIAVGTVSKLQHTPITGIGHNITYHSDNIFELFDESELDKCETFYKKTANVITSNFQEIKHSLAYENYVLNVTYYISRERNSIRFNYSYGIDKREKIESYLMSFKENIKDSETLYSELVKQNDN